MDSRILLPPQQLPAIESAAFLKTTHPVTHPDRTLPFHDMIYLVNGTMQVIEDDHEYLLTPGNILFLKSGLHHWGTDHSPPGTSWYYVHFQLPAGNPPDTSDSIPLPKHLDMTKDMDLEKRLQELTQLSLEPAPLQRALCNTRLYELLLTCSLKELASQPVSPTVHRIQQVIDYLEEHQQETLDTVRLSQLMGLSYKHLGTVFKEHTGHTIVEYHTQLRIQTAARLLRETDMSVAQIGEYLGFHDAFYFSNVFKKALRCSPRDYRKSLFLK
ncbi:MAG: helix-turn-helix transcriptional regulator [Lachnospiraceae bacterium]|nr:helix-turn-helix transcriptional regulator [Lachnospiraceae bacterium]